VNLSYQTPLQAKATHWDGKAIYDFLPECR
jgi:hypothetical protein